MNLSPGLPRAPRSVTRCNDTLNTTDEDCHFFRNFPTPSGDGKRRKSANQRIVQTAFGAWRDETGWPFAPRPTEALPEPYT